SGSGEDNRTIGAYHSGAIDDPAFVRGGVGTRVRGPLLAVGFSLGGNVLRRVLAGRGEQAGLDAAAAISVPFDLQGCARSLDAGAGLTSIYRIRFLRSRRAKARRKAARFPGRIDLERLGAVRGIEAFDDAVTAPIHGFGSASAYY